MPVTIMKPLMQPVSLSSNSVMITYMDLMMYSILNDSITQRT